MASEAAIWRDRRFWMCEWAETRKDTSVLTCWAEFLLDSAPGFLRRSVVPKGQPPGRAVGGQRAKKWHSGTAMGDQARQPNPLSLSSAQPVWVFKDPDAGQNHSLSVQELMCTMGFRVEGRIEGDGNVREWCREDLVGRTRAHFVALWFLKAICQAIRWCVSTYGHAVCDIEVTEQSHPSLPAQMVHIWMVFDFLKCFYI